MADSCLQGRIVQINYQREGIKTMTCWHTQQLFCFLFGLILHLSTCRVKVLPFYTLCVFYKYM